MPRNRRHLVATVAVVLGAASALAGCGDDTDEAVSTTAVAADDGAESDEGAETDDGAEAGSDPFCDAYVDATLQLGGEPDPAALSAAVDTIDESAPEALAEPAGVVTAAVRDVLASGGSDFSAFETEEFVGAKEEVDGFVFDECPFDDAIAVEGRDYSFTGLPESMAAGRVAIMFTNEGTEAHEIALARRNDGVTESFAELLALPEDEAMAKVTPMGGAFAPVNGSSALLVADLEPGDYVALCFVPVGSMMTDDGPVEGDGPPHLAHGMQQEFTVTG